MKLYYVPKTRATRVRWILEELGVPYELVRLVPGNDTRSPEHLKRHPLGHVPVLEDGGHHIFESTAICLYLCDKFPEKRLVPPVGSLERGLVYQWLFYAVTELEPPLGAVSGEARKSEPERDTALVASARERFRHAAQALGPLLEKQPFLVREFSVADAVVAAVLAWAKVHRLEAPPPVEAYTARLLDRPAWRRARAD